METPLAFLPAQPMGLWRKWVVYAALFVSGSPFRPRERAFSVVYLLSLALS